MAFRDELRTLRIQDGITQEELASRMGLAKSAISMYETGKRTPDIETLEAFADYFNVDMNRLIGSKTSNSLPAEAGILWQEFSGLNDTGKRAVRAVIRELKTDAQPEPKRTKVIPLFGTAAAAGPGEMDTGMPWEDYEVPEDSRADFAVRISGDSMEPYLHDGTIVLGKRGNPVDGDVAVLLVDGAFLVKQVCEDSFGNLYLFALNRERSDADDTIMHDSGRTVRCFGTVIMDKRVNLPGR